MWNSPNRKFNKGLQLTPFMVQGMVGELLFDFDHLRDDLSTKEHLIITTGIRGGITNGLNSATLAIKALDVIHITLSPEPVPEGGHSGLEEALLYGMFKCWIDVARDTEHLYTKKEFKKDNLDPLNAILKMNGMKKVSTFSDIDDDYFQDLVDDLFFWDRDWELISLDMSPKHMEQFGISSDYFGKLVRVPDMVDFDVAYETLVQLSGEKINA
jgi:hypothetical protein